MKIAYCSDLHLEVGKRDFLLPDADLLILAGDIVLGYDLRDVWEYNYISVQQRDFLVNVSMKYKSVIWIPGNHEYWYNSLETAITDIKYFLDTQGITNIHFSECDTYIFNDIKFICTTLWTDVNKGSPLILDGQFMKDYINIKNFTMFDGMKLHSEMRDYISSEVQDHDKVIVVTHHAPNLLSTKRENGDLDYFYACTDMDDIILDNPQIKYWINGHTHHHISYMIGDTKVVSNPRGYKGYEKMANTFEIKVIEV